MSKKYTKTDLPYCPCPELKCFALLEDHKTCDCLKDALFYPFRRRQCPFYKSKREITREDIKKSIKKYGGRFRYGEGNLDRLA